MGREMTLPKATIKYCCLRGKNLFETLFQTWVRRPLPTYIKKTTTFVVVFFMGREMGFEPTNIGTTIRGLNHLTTPAIFLIISSQYFSAMGTPCLNYIFQFLLIWLSSHFSFSISAFNLETV